MKFQVMDLNNKYLASFRIGEEKGFEFFFRLHYQPLCFFANRYLQDMPAAEDVVSEVFIKVWEKRESIVSAAGLKSYLYKSVYNGCMRWKQSTANSRRSAVSIEAGARSEQPAIGSLQLRADDERGYAENVIRTEVIRDVYNAIELLPKECKKIFTKIFIEGKTVKEIAEELSLSVSTVKTQKARALSFLRGRLSPMWAVIIFIVAFWIIPI